MMNILAHQRLGLGLLLVALPEVLSAETSTRAQQMQETDPTGIVLTLTAVTVVFLALALLIAFFTLLGKLMQSLSSRPSGGLKPEYTATSTPQKPQSKDEEIALAISLALQTEALDPRSELVAAIALSLADYAESQHDHESYRLTIRPRVTAWNHRGQAMRQYPY